MKEGLLQLLGLQEIDKELKALEEAKDKYPAEIAERQAEIEQATATLRAQEEELEESERDHRSLERELEAARESLTQQEARFAEVTNNREYDVKILLDCDGNPHSLHDLCAFNAGYIFAYAGW